MDGKAGKTILEKSGEMKTGTLGPADKGTFQERNSGSAKKRRPGARKGKGPPQDEKKFLEVGAYCQQV